MTTREALAELKNVGVNLTYWELRGMIVRGEIPTPRLNSTLKFDWTAGDIARVKDAAAQREAAACKR